MPVIVQCPHLDALESAFAANQLTQVRSKTYDLKLGVLKGRSLVPVDTSVNPGAQVISYHQYTPVGMAVLIANYAQDLPRADVFVKEFFSKVAGIGNSYGFSIQEIRAAKYAGVSLDQKKANAARRAHEERHESLIRLGDSTAGLLGLLNQPNVTVYTVPNNAANTSALWVNKTPDEILKDMNGIVNKIVKDTKEVEYPDTLLLPLDQYTLVNTTPRHANSDTTILEFFLSKNDWVKQVIPWSALTTAGSGGTARMVAYRRDPDALQYIEPQPFEQLAPQTEGLEIVTYCHGRSGGVVVYYPLSIAYGDGI